MAKAVAAPPKPVAKAPPAPAKAVAPPAKVKVEKVAKEPVQTATGEAKQRGKTGTTLGMSVKQTWKHLFEMNESLPQNEKWTDTQIAEFMQAEFPRADGTVPTEYLPEGIGRVRTYYNNGSGTGEKPTVQSYRYNDAGVVMGGPRGTMTAIRSAERDAAKAQKAAERDAAKAEKEALKAQATATAAAAPKPIAKAPPKPVTRK